MTAQEYANFLRAAASSLPTMQEAADALIRDLKMSGLIPSTGKFMLHKGDRVFPPARQDADSR